MRHLTQPNRWTCVPTSFAMAADVSLEKILEIIGHDGSAIVHPDLNEPWRRRAFHIQECIWAVRKLGFSVTPFEIFPQLAAAPHYEIAIERTWSWFEIMSGFGVVTGSTERNRHAVAFSDHMGYDPNGEQIDFGNQTKFAMDTIWHFDLI